MVSFGSCGMRCICRCVGHCSLCMGLDYVAGFFLLCNAFWADNVVRPLLAGEEGEG